MKDLFPRAVSIIFHPLFLPFYLLLLLFSMDFYAPMMLPEKAKILLAVIVFFTTVMMPLLMNFLFLKMKLVSSLRMENRDERIYPLLTQAVFLYLTYYLLKQYQIPFIFSFYLLGATFLVLAAFAVTIFYKISLHMIGMGGVFGFLTSMAIFFNLPITLYILVSILLCGIVGSVRIKSDSHKISEIYSGFLVGTIGMMLLFLLV